MIDRIRSTNKEYRIETIKILENEKQLFVEKVKMIEKWIELNKELIKHNI